MTIVLVTLVAGIVYSIAEYQPIAEELAQIAEVEDVSEDSSVTQSNGDTMFVFGDGFSLQVPEDWIVTTSDSERSSNGVLTYGWIYSAEQESAYGDPDVVRIRVEDVLKGDLSFSEVLDEHDSLSAISAVKGMQRYANAPYNEITVADIIDIKEQIVFNGFATQRNTFVCTRECHIEGLPPAEYRYFIDVGDRVFIIDARTVYSDSYEQLLNQADEVIATFVLNE